MAHPVFLMHIQSLLSGYAPGSDSSVSLCAMNCSYDYVVGKKFKSHRFALNDPIHTVQNIIETSGGLLKISGGQ